VMVKERVFNATGMHVEISHLSLSLPPTIILHDLVLRDDKQALIFEAKQGSLFVDMIDIIKWNFAKIWVDIEQGKLHSVPRDKLGNKTNNDTTIKSTPPPEIFISISNLEIAPEVIHAIDAPSSLDSSSLNLKNVYFHSSGDFHEVKGKILCDSLRINEFMFHKLNAHVDWKQINNQATGQIILSALLEDKDVSIDADFYWPFGQPLTVNAVELRFDQALISEATAEFSIQDLPKLPKDLQFTAKKALYRDLELFDVDLKTTFDAGPIFHLIANKAKYQDLELVNIDLKTALISEATAEFSIQDLPKLLKDLQFAAKKVSYRDLELLDVDLKTTFDAGPVFHLIANKAKYQDLELANIDLKTALTPTSQEQPLALITEGKWKGHTFIIDTDANYTYGKDQLQIAFKILSGSIDAIPFTLNEPGVFYADQQKLSLEPLNFTLDETILKGAIGIVNDQFSGIGSVSSSKYPHADVSIQFPLTYSMNPFTFDFDKNAPLSGSVAAEGDLATILQRLLDSPTSFSGRAKAVVNLAGTIDSPLFNGSGEISDGAYEIPEIGVSLKDLTAKIESSGTKLTITTIEAVDGKGGRLFGTGNYHIDKELNYPFSLELTLAEATLLNQDYVKVVCDGPLLFSGNSNEGALSGQLQVSKASVDIPERSYSTINTVDVTYINIPKDMPKPQSYGIQKSRWPLALDIRLGIERVLTIKGKDLDSSWKGELAVQGFAKAPLLFGELKIISGQYLFNGNPFSINQGTITFAGELDKKTTLYVIAGKDLDKVKVDVIAKGPVKNPVISFRSNPPLPQREILSWILFNRGTSEISPFQGAQLSESITNLSTQQQGPDVLSKIRSTFKIDRFEISRNPQSDDHSVNVEVGKYISDNILISVIKSDVNRVAVEANITDNIKLRAQVGDDSQGQLLLKWKKDY
ncbi:MAG TPA: translocation/assembly module TamB domain-containing protein, partial [Parachlamydiaceae bacterium]|nr:translocation/assembly module TamB domain-containing protein [Parachlamydiaceae bacterium]